VAEASQMLSAIEAEIPEHGAHVELLRTFIQTSTRGIIR
jgi:hypothetical protein